MKKLKATTLTPLLLLLSSICCTLATSAQTCLGYKHEFGRQAGEMARSHISNAQQDANGFMWFATWNGLIRYDGYTTHIFKPIQHSAGTIDSDRIYNIKTTTAGDIWCVSSDNRLFIFDTDRYIFTNLSQSIPQITDKKVKVLTPLKNGHTWVTFRDMSLLRLNDTVPSRATIFYPSPDSLVAGAGKITGISLTENGDEWLLTDNGAFNHTSQQFYRGNYRFVTSLHKTTYLISSDGTIIQPESGKIFAPPHPGINVSYIRTDINKIILATDKGILSTDIHDGTVRHYSYNPSTYIFKDSRHRIWGFEAGRNVTLIPDLSSETSIY